jgi:hypothetical protein
LRRKADLAAAGVDPKQSLASIGKSRVAYQTGSSCKTPVACPLLASLVLRVFLPSTEQPPQFA